MPGQSNQTSDAVLLLVEPADGMTDLSGRLEAAGLRYERLRNLAEERRDDFDPALVILPARALPDAGPAAVGEALGFEADVPVLVLAETPAAAADVGEGTVAVVTLPASPAALRALIAGLQLDRGVALGRVRARAPGGNAPGALYEEVVAAADAAFASAREERPPDLDRARLLAERIHSQLLRDNGLVLLSLEPHDEFDMASHSANVAIIAGKIALGMAMGIEDVVRVVMAGIIHDIGMARLPEGLIRKPGRLTELEREKLREHPVLGAELLEDVAPRHAWVQDVVLQEHERMHGQGYPAGLVGQAIDPLAQVIGLADVFEALSHPRSYRSPYTALEALEQVSEMKGEYFETGVVAALVNEISAFPLDSYVQLSTGAIAQVVGTNPDNILRPEVLVRWDADWSTVDPPRRLDLSESPEITVARALLEAELPIT
ncbi:MAG: HD domain-containing protein [Gemmatimonadota bacterium]|nr:HD domain-containing protein [Gemmatimonadota bacterium]